MKFRRTFLSVLALCGVAASVFAGGCRSQSSAETARLAVENEKNAIKANSDSLSELGGNIVTTGTTLQGPDSQGRLLWEVKAKQIRARDERTENGVKLPREARLVGASATLFRSGKPESTFVAQNILLLYKPAGVQMQLSGGVQMTTTGALVRDEPLASAVSLQSAQMQVDVKARRVVAQKGVTMKSRGATVTAATMSADSALGIANLGGGLKLVSPQGEARADSGVWNWQSGRAQAKGHVVLTHDGTTLTGSTLNADTNAARGTLAGDVRAVSSDGEARAAELKYNWKTGSLVARGGVSLTKGGATLRAARIDADDKLGNAVASGDVVLVKDDTTIRAGRLEARDKMTRAVASGGVFVTRADETLRAAKAVVWIGEKRAQASGDVIVTRAGSTMRAAAATVWMNQKRAVATGDVRLARGDLAVRAARVEATNWGERATLRLAASGDVRAQNADGAVRAARVNWGGGRVVASGGVSLRRGENTLRGEKLESDDRFRAAKLEGDIGGGFAGGGTVSARTLFWRAEGNSSRGKITGTGGVRVRRDDLTLRADNFETSGDGARATLTGNVVVTRDDGSTVRAPKVRYDKGAQKIWATGGVSYADPKRGLRQTGKTLVADLKLQQATLTDVEGSGRMNMLSNKKLF